MKSTVKEETLLKNSKSHPDLLSCNNYIKLGNYEQKEIDKYFKTFRTSFDKSEAESTCRLKDSRRLPTKKSEDKVFIKTAEKKIHKKMTLGSPYAKKPQRFVRKNA